MTTFLNKTVSTRTVVYSLLAVFGIYAVFFGPGAIQYRNMKYAASMKDDIVEYLSHDENYSHLTISIGTANLGRNLYIIGQVPTQDSLELLQEIITAKFNDDVIEIKFMVKVITPED